MPETAPPQPQAKFDLWFGLACFTLAVTAICYALNWWVALEDPYCLTFEGPMIWAAARLSNFQNIYPLSGLSGEPWSVILYPPLYMLLAAIPIKLFGVSLVWLRLINMVSLLIGAASLYRVARLCDASRTNAVIASVFFLNFGAVAFLSYEGRPDLLAIGLSLWMMERFMSALAKSDSNPTFQAVIPAAVLGLLAFCAKQQAIVFLLAVVLFALAGGRRKLAAQLAGFWIASIAAVFILLEIISSGGFWANFTMLKQVKPQASVLADNLRSLGPDWIKVAVGFALIPLGLLLSPNKSFHASDRLPLILFFISFALMLYTMAIPASNVNHLIPLMAAFALLVASSLRNLPRWVGSLVLAVCLLNAIYISEQGRLYPQILPHARAGAEELKKLNLAGTTVLTDDPYVNMWTGSREVIVDCATFLNAWKDTGKPPERMLQDIAQQRYAAILINHEDSEHDGNRIWWTPEIVRAIKQNYTMQKMVFCSGWPMDLYLPKSATRQ